MSGGVLQTEGGNDNVSESGLAYPENWELVKIECPKCHGSLQVLEHGVPWWKQFCDRCWGHGSVFVLREKE